MSFIGGNYGPSTPSGSSNTGPSVYSFGKLPETKKQQKRQTANTNTYGLGMGWWHGYSPAKPQNSFTDDKTLKITKKDPVKIATSNLFMSEQPQYITEELLPALFEDFGAMELINISRHDSLNGQDVIYQPIKNMTQLSFDYNPQNILAATKTDADLTRNFLIDIGRYIPSEPSNPSIVYLDDTTNDIIIETINVREDERIEVEFLTYEKLENDTIYIT